jgi:hypothetical protein
LVVRRLTSVIAGVNWSEASRRLAGWLDPVAGATALYNAAVAYVGRANERIEPASGSQLERIEETLRSLELERAERLKAAHPQAAPPAPAYRAADQAALAGVPLRARRTGGARWSRGRRALPAGR